MKVTGSRDIRLDILRVISMTMIVFMHAPLPGSAPGYVLSGLSYLTAPGLVLFFMISGALLLGNSLSTKEFLKRRLTKVVFPTLFWSFFYLAYTTVVGHGFDSKELLMDVLSIPFSAQGHGVLWFMYALVGLYLLTPILSRWLKNASKQEVEFYLLLWTITLVYPYLKLILKINESDSGILYYFTGYAGYFLLGYYLYHFYRFKLWHIVAALVAYVLVPAILYGGHFEFDFYSMLWYLSLPVASMALVWFVLINKLPRFQNMALVMASKLSFGVYFVHVFVLRAVLWHVDLICKLPGILQILVLSLSTLAISYFVSWLISKLPFSKYIIGV